MAEASRTLVVVVVVGLALGSVAASRASAPDAPRAHTLTQGKLIRPVSDGRVPVRLVAAGRITGRWHGQDQRDVVGDAATLGPNGVQDLHFSLAGLPPRNAIVKAVVTGHGADQWEFPARPNQNQYAAVIVRKPRAATADVFVEPNRVETGREFCLHLTFDNGEVVDVFIKGGKADPNHRMPAAALALIWVGQERFDLVGAGPGVGPDGLVDARIGMTRLSKKEKVQAIRLEDASGTRWEFGINKEGANNAEIYLDPKDPTQGSLFFQPDRDFSGRRLALTVVYEGGKSDASAVVGGKTDAKLAMPKPAVPKLPEISLAARWLGQDGSAATGPGDVHVALSGLSGTSPLAGAVLSDGVSGTWVFRGSDRSKFDAEPDARPLAFRRGPARGTADLYFPPTRDESGTPMTLRLVYQNGEMAFATIPGGPADPSRLAPTIDRSETSARPGDDLAGLVARFGTVKLAPGTYPLTQPLVLPRPVALVGAPGAVLEFSQRPGGAPWTSALKVHAGGTTLRGFAVRFKGPIRWRTEVSWGPAVIGTTDNLDNLPSAPKHGLVFEGLDLKGPESSKPSGWEESVKLMRLINAPGGRIVGNTLRGGAIEFFHGPWLIEKNTFLGTARGTFSPTVFAAHDPHDLTVRGNRAESEPGSGKTWRFLLMTTRGASDRVESNVISGIGPRDDDTIPAMNQPEIILTESYHLRFEGRPAAVSADGRLVKLHRLPGEPPATGDVVSVLSGNGAGQWRRIAQRIEPTVYLLDAPLPRGADVLAVSPGFVGDVFQNNTIDARGGGAAAGFVLAGNHFGARVAGNLVRGAGDAYQLSAYPSESPGIWGWSHAPFLGGLFEGNTVEDSLRGIQIGVLHNPSNKANKGRVYLSMALKGTTVTWTDAFLARPGATATPPQGITLGWLPSIDPGEAVVEMRDDRLVAPSRAPTASALKVNAATLNGRPVSQKTFALPLPAAMASGAFQERALPR